MKTIRQLPDALIIASNSDASKWWCLVGSLPLANRGADIAARCAYLLRPDCKLAAAGLTKVKAPAARKVKNLTRDATAQSFNLG